MPRGSSALQEQPVIFSLAHSGKHTILTLAEIWRVVSHETHR